MGKDQHADFWSAVRELLPGRLGHAFQALRIEGRLDPLDLTALFVIAKEREAEVQLFLCGKVGFGRMHLRSKVEAIPHASAEYKTKVNCEIMLRPWCEVIKLEQEVTQEQQTGARDYLESFTGRLFFRSLGSDQIVTEDLPSGEDRGTTIISEEGTVRTSPDPLDFVAAVMRAMAHF